MFRLAGNKEIGAYLRKLINEKDISIRRFGTMMLEQRGEPTDPASVQRIANRLSQILSGSKSVQLAEDARYFGHPRHILRRAVERGRDAGGHRPADQLRRRVLEG